MSEWIIGTRILQKKEDKALTEDGRKRDEDELLVCDHLNANPWLVGR